MLERINSRGRGGQRGTKGSVILNGVGGERKRVGARLF